MKRDVLFRIGQNFSLCFEHNYIVTKSLVITNNILFFLWLKFFAGTVLAQIYRFNFNDFCNEVISTCHYASVKDISFP